MTNLSKLINKAVEGLDKNFYFEQKKKNSDCRCCGKKCVETKMLFYKTGWSRGDDDYLGKICKECKQKMDIGKIEVNWKENKWVFELQSLTKQSKENK